MVNPSIGFVSLGCPKALVDSEQIITRLRAEGYEISSGYEEADLVIVNTCGFIDSAVEESLDAIGEALRENGKVIVTGCLGAKAGAVSTPFPQVLAVTGPHATDEVLQLVHQHVPKPHDPFVDLVPPAGVKLTPPHFAYLKISEGCNHRCTFCIIPQLRGDLVSRPIHEILDEAQKLVDSGVRELLIVSQDTSAYGLDVKYRTGFWQGRPLKTNLQTLCEELGRLGVWVRLHYVYPYPSVDQLIPLMAAGKIAPYLDIPLQHASPKILKAMQRPANMENTLERIQRWRAQCPELVLRSTFIVGFPGETDEDFQALLDFLSAAQLDRVGCFTYSDVEGAPANAFAEQVPEEVKLNRQAQLMEWQADISAAKLAAKIDHTVTVLVDAIDDEGAMARTIGDAPDVDGLVFIEDADGLEAGEFAQVRIIDADEHDLWAEKVA